MGTVFKFSIFLLWIVIGFLHEHIPVSVHSTKYDIRHYRGRYRVYVQTARWKYPETWRQSKNKARNGISNKWFVSRFIYYFPLNFQRLMNFISDHKDGPKSLYWNSINRKRRLNSLKCVRFKVKSQTVNGNTTIKGFILPCAFFTNYTSRNTRQVGLFFLPLLFKG